MVGRDGSGNQQRHAAQTTPEYCWGYPSVAPSVGPMTSSDSASRLTHAPLASTSEMADDCRATTRHLRLDGVARAAVSAPPSLCYEDYPREVAKRDIRVSEAAARLAEALYGK